MIDYLKKRIVRRINIIIFYLSFCFIDCFIKIPFKYYPNKLNNNTNPKDIILSILDVTMYGFLEMGTPKQIIHIPIRMSSNTFFLPQKSTYYYNKNNDFILYNETNSSTFSIVYKQDFYEGENFEEALYVNDVFYFGKEKVNLDFYLSVSYYFPQMGGLGLQLYPSNNMNTATPSIDKTFLRKLKLKGLINNYIWSICYNYNNNSMNTDGYILIGDYPHLIDDFLMEKDSNYSLNSIEAKIYNKIVETSFIMDSIHIYNGNEINIINEVDFGDETINIRLDYIFGGILAPEQLRIYLENNVFNKEFCYKEVVDRISKNIFYYCQNNQNTIDKLRKSFPLIKFESKILNSSFIIDIDDLILIKDNYIFILLIFDEKSNNDWTLGIPFLKKYQFSVNQDSKRIAFYKKIENAKTKSEKNYTLILIIILLIILLLAIVIIGIIIFNKNKRKKRKNELDDNYEYIINDDNINDTKKNIDV